MKSDSPFLDVKSFVMEEDGREEPETTTAPENTPFLSLYESHETGELIDPETEEYVAFLNELYDEEFDEALSGLVSEASAIFETQFMHEREDPQTAGYQGERLLNQHFAPLIAEAEAMFEALAAEFSQHDPKNLTDNEIESIVDRYTPSAEFTPTFENFWGKLKKAVKNVAKKAVTLAKKGVSLATKLGLGPILNKLKALVKPLLKRVIQTAIGKLPPYLQPAAKKLAQRLPYLKEFEESYEGIPDYPKTYEIAEIQYEFNQEIANVLFARSEVEMEMEVAKVQSEPQAPDTYPVAELDLARDQFVENLTKLKEGEDPSPHVENFVPAILPALRVGIRLVGRKRVVNFLAQFLGRLIQKFVGPQYAPALSQAIVDAGLRLLQLETTPEEESRAAASAVAATVEETVRRVAAAPDYILDSQELLEGFALEAFEQAAAANLPSVLSEETYQKRPELTVARKHRGVWIMMPRTRGKMKRYKKYSRRIPIKLVPHKVSEIETFEDLPLNEFLEEQHGVAPGEEVEAFVHLFEAVPGTNLSDISRQEENIPSMGEHGYEQLHPLTKNAAGLLLGETEFGRDTESESLINPQNTVAGQRYYYLEISGKRLLTVPSQSGRAEIRRRTKARLILDFPGNEIRFYLFLSEIRAQEITVKLRQHAHIGMVATRLRQFVERGLRSALIKRSFKRLKIIHETVTPDQWLSALRRLPSLVPRLLAGKLQEWILKGLFDHLKQRPEEFIKAAEDTSDGVTMTVTLRNPPGLPQLRQALKGKGIPLSRLNLTDGMPTVKIDIKPGYTYE